MKKAIIIGATSGIGQEVARILVQQGWHISCKMSVTGWMANRSSRQTAICSRKPATGSTGSDSNSNVGRNPGRCRREIEYAHRQGGRHGFVSS